MKRWQEHIISWIINIPTLGFYRLIIIYTHHDMNKGECNSIYRSTYSEFKTEFLKQEWKIEKEWRKSLFDIDNNYDKNYIHASIFKINGICHNMTTYGYIKAQKLIKSKIISLGGNYGNKYIKQLP